MSGEAHDLQGEPSRSISPASSSSPPRCSDGNSIVGAQSCDPFRAAPSGWTFRLVGYCSMDPGVVGDALDALEEEPA